MPPNNKGKMRENSKSDEDVELELSAGPAAEVGLSVIEGSMAPGLSTYPRCYQEDVTQQMSTSSFIQRLLPNTSEDKASAALFGGPTDSMKIKGGIFNQTLGDYNVTINVNGEHRVAERDAFRQYPAIISSFIEWVSKLLRTKAHVGNQNHASERHSPPLLASQTSYHSEAAPSTQDPSTSITAYSPDNSNKIYERHLWLKQRGFPLWNPGPNRTLPMAYRRKGLDIGDVGIITPDGGFSFLFNICLPPDHPFNPPMLPEGFTSIPLHLIDKREYLAFNPESHLASAIEKIDDPQFPGLSFVTSAAQGAVLTLPDGALACDVENISRFRVYAAANIENWYRYANGPRGREVRNGDIRLVYGCDKATSWGMAAFANMAQHQRHYLKYRSVADGGAAPAPIPLYKWEYTGLTEARVGPELREIEDLKRNDDSDTAIEGNYRNQSLFIRTLNLKIDEKVFAKINQEVESALIEELQQYRSKGSAGSSTNNAPDTSTQTGQRFGETSMNTGFSSENLCSSMQNLTLDDVSRVWANMLRSPTAPQLHPADFLNEFLLQKVPNSRVVITEDENWCSVVKEDDDIMLSFSEVAERVLAEHHIRSENGVVFLEPKAAPFLCTVTGCKSTFTRHSNLKGHLLSHDEYKCKGCRKQFWGMDALSEHLRSMAGEKCAKTVESAPGAGDVKVATTVKTTQFTTTVDNSEVMIAVMGTTGSGKTSFINLASGTSDLQVGRGLESCTNVVQVARPFMLNGRSVTLIDTPGFDATYQSDTEILRMIRAFLATKYENGEMLSGVIYIHRISDARMSGISTQNFKMFRQLCGDSTLQNVVIVTNMWSEVTPEVGEAREAELASQDMFFKPALDKGALILRHYNTRESAQAILQHVIQNRPMSLQIQRELVDEKKVFFKLQLELG